MNTSMGECKKDVTPLLMHWSYVLHKPNDMIRSFVIMSSIMEVIFIYADMIENQEHHELKICRLDWLISEELLIWNIIYINYDLIELLNLKNL